MVSNYDNMTGRTLGTCILERMVGQGGMGSVYLAQQTRPSRRVAVKVLQPNLSMNSEVYQDFLVRFRREADVIARLEQVNIMPIYEYGEQDGLAYLVMPYLSGGSLRDVLNQRGPLPLDEVTTYIEQAAAALDYAHSQGVIHRDLKPANFLLASDGRLVLADFGIARIMEESASNSAMTGTGTVLGTAEYMAPEMARGEPIDYRVDIYELGIVLFQMLSGHVPFTGSTPISIAAKHIQEQMPLLQRENPAILPAVDAVIQKATAKYVDDRYTSTRAMAQALRSAITGGVASAATYYDYDQVNSVPTMQAGGQPMVLPPVPQYSTTTTVQQPNTMPPVAGWENSGSQYPGYANYNSQPGAYGNYSTPAGPYAPQQRKRSPLWWIVGALVLLVLISSGVFAATQLNKGTAGTAKTTQQQGTTPAKANTPATQKKATTQTTATTKATVQATTTQQPTPAPTAIKQPTTPPTTIIPAGQQIYAATTPDCNNSVGTWTPLGNPLIGCLTRTRITSTALAAGLQGIFLTALPNQRAYPTDYEIKVRLRHTALATSDFGVSFRSQASTQNGTYSLLIHPDGTWGIYRFDNAGQQNLLGTGTGTANVKGTNTIDIIAKGPQITASVNGNALQTQALNDPTYPQGTVGLIVGQGNIIDASTFSLSTPPA